MLELKKDFENTASENAQLERSHYQSLPDSSIEHFKNEFADHHLYSRDNNFSFINYRGEHMASTDDEVASARATAQKAWNEWKGQMIQSLHMSGKQNTNPEGGFNSSVARGVALLPSHFMPDLRSENISKWSHENNENMHILRRRIVRLQNERFASAATEDTAGPASDELDQTRLRLDSRALQRYFLDYITDHGLVKQPERSTWAILVDTALSTMRGNGAA
ncbi:uncharacterized protein I303_106612 [Kwoniella dejecticola CBS 10117]|uniref:Uncharacterized protein n=1 Tax=Kwoniella dejecticola CBS 10117 TaxID=1296121 RepID=A0A1A5ZU70_9TREE|nr:uncharacterized protein I303_08129 [Kwoniella dejecticola CBS 10117]OBR81359.1 hypothetical protein I303_08129 [Kwoniella dejecticola CBS 10117]